MADAILHYFHRDALLTFGFVVEKGNYRRGARFGTCGPYIRVLPVSTFCQVLLRNGFSESVPLSCRGVSCSLLGSLEFPCHTPYGQGTSPLAAVASTTARSRCETERAKRIVNISGERRKLGSRLCPKRGTSWEQTTPEYGGKASNRTHVSH
jgi:hypothetical protein